MEREKYAFFFSPPSFPFARSSNMATSSIAARSLLAHPPKKPTSVGQSARNLDNCDRKKKTRAPWTFPLRRGYTGQLATSIFRATPYRVFMTTPYRVFETNSKTRTMLPNPVLRRKSFPVTCYTRIDFPRYGVVRKIVVPS